MLPTALQCGIRILDYWDLTYGEIVLTIKAYRESENARIREAASFNYSLANLIGLSVARLMDNKAEYPSLKKAYPTLFDDLIEDTRPVQQDWEIAKERLVKYAEANNKKKRGDL